MAKEDERKESKEASRQIDAVIDRIEDGDIAVLLIGKDEETQVDMPLSLLPEGAADGDHLRVTISIDRSPREAAEERIRQLQDQLKQQGGTKDKKNFKL